MTLRTERVRVHRRRVENHIGSQFGPGIAALAVLRNSQVLQAAPRIVGLVALCTGTNTSFCTTLTTSGKLFDTTSTGMFPGCPHFIRDTDSISSLIVKVSKLIHLQTVREMLDHSYVLS